jgi:hypothetical protein
VDDLRRVWRPVDVDDQEIGLCVRGNIHPPRIASRNATDSQLDRWIRVARLRVIGDFELRTIRQVIDDGVLRHRAFVQLKEGNARRIRTPPVGAEPAPAVDLLLIQPVELAVEDLGAAVAGDRALAA